MPLLDTIEKGLLFRITRLVTLLFICVLTIAIVVTGFIAYKRLAVDMHVSPAAVLGPAAAESERAAQAARAEAEAARAAAQAAADGVPVPESEMPSQAAISQPQPGISLPFNLQKHFSDPDNLAVLERHTADLNEAERKEYIDNLSEVVTAAESQHVDVIAVINKYFELKGRKLQGKPSEMERMLVPLYTGGAIFALLLLIAVFSLVLVLLAIERNTRNEDEQDVAAMSAGAGR
jgi:hypothetical protein